MKFLLFVTIAVVSVSGQFLEPEFRVGSVPLNLRRGIGGTFEIRPSVGREFENKPDGTASSSQGRRHIETQRHIRLGPNRNMNDYELQPDENVFQSNDQNERQSPNRRLMDNRRQNADQYPVIQEQNQANNLRTNDRLYTNLDNTGIQYSNNGRDTLGDQIANARTNIQNTAQLNQDAYILRDSHSNGNAEAVESYPSQQNTGVLTRNDENENTRQITQTQREKNIKPSTARSPNAQNNQNNFNVNHNRNIESTLRVNNNNYYPNEREQATGDRTTDSNKTEIDTESRGIEDSTKSAQDNELLNNKPRSDDKWVWTDGSEMQIANTTIKPTGNVTVDDRASFSGSKCPTGMIRLNNNVCVSKA